MLHLVDTLDSREKKIISRSIEHALQACEKLENINPFLDVGLELPLFMGWSKEDFVKLLNSLEEMHQDLEQEWYLTDYHFIVLYKVMKWAIQDHNLAVMTGETPILVDASYTINFDDVTTRIFHDTRFLWTAEAINSLSSKEREELGLTPELFSICNGLTPHPTEVVAVPKQRRPKGRSGAWI